MSMFFVFRSGRSLALAALVSAMLLPTLAFSQNAIYRWDFNAQNTNSSVGAGGTATLIGGVTATFVGGKDGGTKTIAANSSDPGSGANSDNFVWKTTNYPAINGASGTSGARFAGVNTTGLTNLLFAFDLAAVDESPPPVSSSGSRWYQVRYSTDGTTFTNLGGPLEYQRAGSTNATLWANQTVLSLAGVAPAANLRFEVVSVHAPGTSFYAPAQAGTSYSSSAPVFLDFVSVYQGNTWNSTAGSGDIQTGSNWSNGAPAPGNLSSHLMFGGNENAAVTVTNTADSSNSRFLSLSFTTAANSTAYTLTGNQIDLGKQTSSSGGTLLAGATTLVNASNRQQTISAPVFMNTSQVWDSGPTANGGSLLINSPALVFNTLGSGMTLTVTGQNQTTISAPFTFLGNNTITKTGGGTLTLPTANTNLGGGTLQVNVNGGSLAVTNATGSATADAAIAVNSGGRLTGHGQVQPGFLKTVTVANGGKISPGTSAATAATRDLTIAAGGLTFQSGGIYEVNVFGNGAADTGLLNVTGSVNGSAGMAVHLNLLNGVDRDTLRVTVGPGNTRIYTLTNVSAASTWTVTGNNFASLGFSPGEWVASQQGNNLILTFTPVPDARFALGVAGAALLSLAAVRRKKLAARTVSGA